MTHDIDKIRERFNRDAFAAGMGAYIESVFDDGALCSAKISPHLLNSYGGVQGGAIFTLADFAFAVASNIKDKLTLSLNCNITFMRPVKGSVIYARAKRISEGRRTCLYEVTVYDDEGTSVAHMTVGGYSPDKKE